MSKVKNRQTSNKTSKTFKNSIIRAMVCFIMLLLFSIICTYFDVPIEYMSLTAMIYISSCSFISGFITGLKERKNGLTSGVLQALPMNALLIVISLAINGFKPDFSLVVMFFSGILMSATGGVISVNLRLKG